MVESLKVNKEIKGLEKFVSEHVLTTLSTPEKQKVKKIIACLEERYGRTRLEKIEELVLDWIGFRDDDYEVEGDFYMLWKSFQRRKEDLKMTDREWNAVWMLKKVKKREGMNDFQCQALRDILKFEGDRTKEFIKKYKEGRVRTSKGKVVNAQDSSSDGGLP